ncbi:Uncharacterised protein [uncultured archaeon]|nr:Uncharacterised protein [uncultured archaeon]
MKERIKNAFLASLFAGICGLTIGLIAIFISGAPWLFGLSLIIICFILGFLYGYTFYKSPWWARLFFGG